MKRIAQLDFLFHLLHCFKFSEEDVCLIVSVGIYKANDVHC